ncbi:hypothetical protein HZA56_05475 [Candidatus Poribacteria bacterium]|nr:hypothetical protein [Candidatus Poribacteria bacterium]
MKTLSLAIAVFGLWLANGNAWAQERFPLGDWGFDPIEYQATLKHMPPSAKATLPSSFDWRTLGAVTTAKDQGYCGSCWAFAVTGVMESKILLAGGPSYNLAEEQQVSCNLSMGGCCGGNYFALQYWYSNGPLEEPCTGYADYHTGCPTETNVACGSLQCEPAPYHSTGLFTVNTGSVDDMKASLYQDGPAYFSYQVYSDFFTFWGTRSPGAVYRQASGAYEGGHAVLIIGWDNSKQAWLCKNSWGATGGPNSDGTFWIAWSGHASSLAFGMANVDLVPLQEPELSQISLVSPTGTPTLGSPPTFMWTADGGSNNAFAVDLSYYQDFRTYWCTYVNLRQTIYSENWMMPASVWNKIPSGKRVYWKVRGADLDSQPLTIIYSNEVRSFYRQ